MKVFILLSMTARFYSLCGLPKSVIRDLFYDLYAMYILGNRVMRVKERSRNLALASSNLIKAQDDLNQFIDMSYQEMTLPGVVFLKKAAL